MYHYYNTRRLSVLFLFIVVFGYCSAATLYPKSLNTQTGTSSSTSLSALKTKDQSGSQDTWARYVEFYGSSNAYSGVFTFDVSSLDSSKVTAYTLDVNFKGPKSSNQVWNFEYYSPSTNSWILAGDNSDAASWEWTALSFCGQESFASIVSGGSLKLRLSSASRKDDCDLDFLAITTIEGEDTTTPTTMPTSAPTEKPTSAPSTAPTTRPSTAPTTRPTSAPTQRPTSAPTRKPTSAPTQKPTSAPTQKPTTAPTQKPTQKPTTAPTQKPTTAPTQKPTTAPTQKPTTAPTQKPTTAPTQKPTNAPSTGGRICPTGQVWVPQPGTTWQWQLTGSVDQSVDVQMYDIDLFDATTSIISSLHSKGRVVICYFSTQYEDWRPDASKFTSDILGANLDDWPGERYVDIRSAKLRKIMTERLDLAVSKGCDGVEPDNVDGYSNSNGLSLKAADQLDYNRFLASEAHKRGLSIGLKNDLDQVSQLVSSFDWALNEQCNEYGECSMLNPFINAGKAVFGVDYSGSGSSVCPKMVTAKMSWLMKDLSLGAKINAQCCTYASGGCAQKAAYTCVNYASKRELENEDLTASVTLEESPIAEEQVNEQVEFDSAASTLFSTFLPAFACFLAFAVLVL